MLLNRVLTVRPGTPASHRGKGWEAVTECAIRALVARGHAAGGDPVGTRRVDAEADAGRRRSRVIESVHPSPLSASRGFFGSRPFSRANELLTGMGAEPIDWRLP